MTKKNKTHITLNLTENEALMLLDGCGTLIETARKAGRWRVAYDATDLYKRIMAEMNKK